MRGESETFLSRVNLLPMCSRFPKDDIMEAGDFFFFFLIFRMNVEELFLMLTSHALFHRAFGAVHLAG